LYTTGPSILKLYKLAMPTLKWGIGDISRRAGKNPRALVDIVATVLFRLKLKDKRLQIAKDATGILQRLVNETIVMLLFPAGINEIPERVAYMYITPAEKEALDAVSTDPVRTLSNKQVADTPSLKFLTDYTRTMPELKTCFTDMIVCRFTDELGIMLHSSEPDAS
jgi:hypothetical protein